jgi:hypothetical protein
MEKNEEIDTKFRKLMPGGVGDVGVRGDITPVYDEEKLDLEAIKTNPILKPLAEINNSFVNFELVINKALLEYQEDKSQIDAMIEANPRYSETIILSKVQSMLRHVKQIIHSQDIQKEDLKKVVKDMVKIAKTEYGLLQEQSKEEVPKAKEETAETGEETAEEKKGETPKEEKPVYSELVEREIPIPKDKSDKEGFVSI